MRWGDTGRPWLPPSPNLRTAEAALAYPGTCLLEATNVYGGPRHRRAVPAARRSLARRPCAREGARAWIRAGPDDFHAARVRGGDRAEAPRRPLPGRPRRGHRRERVAPYELGIRLLHALRMQKGFRWTREGALDWLVGTRRLRVALERGDTPEAILASDADDLARWERERAPFLLY